MKELSREEYLRLKHVRLVHDFRRAQYYGDGEGMDHALKAMGESSKEQEGRIAEPVLNSDNGGANPSTPAK